MNDANDQLGDENQHVQELKRLFLSCHVDAAGRLDAKGLSLLCEKLKLSTFANDIVQRVLLGASAIEFHVFKDRFIALLPEIIDVSSGQVASPRAESSNSASSSPSSSNNAPPPDSLAERTTATLHRLGLSSNASLSRYEMRLVCEGTSGLDTLSVVDINGLFDRADYQGSGRVSIDAFLAQFRLQKRLSTEVHFITESFVGSINLFEALDLSTSGSVDAQDLLEYWSKAGVRIDEGIAALKQCGQPSTGPINAVHLSGVLESELSAAVNEASLLTRVAVITLHCYIDHLRCTVKEGESCANHLQKQLQLANQRRNLLIEELEHNQLSIEQCYDKRLKETEDRYRGRLAQMEEKFRQEKKELQQDLEQCEEELSRSRQAESSSRSKLVLVERQCNRLAEEAREAADNNQQLESLNRQLRAELEKAMQPRPADDPAPLIMWKHRVELLVAHNKRLREKIDELTSSEKRRHSRGAEARFDEPLYLQWTSAFRSQVAMIRKRREAKGDTLSEMESEIESIFARTRRRRLLKKRERRERHKRVNGRSMMNIDSGESSSNNKENRKKTSKSSSDSSRLASEIAQLKEEHRKELLSVRQLASKTLADALNDQEKQLNANFEKERRAFEQKLTGERDAMEAAFAEEKLKLMNRLQEDFDTELRRISSMVNSPDSAANVERYKRQIKMLEASLEGQRKGYEKKLNELRDSFYEAGRRQSAISIDKNATNFMSLVEKYKNGEYQQPGTSESYSPRYFGIDKRSNSSMSSLPKPTGNNNRCERCEVIEVRLRELYHTVAGDMASAESGFEDLCSSADSQHDDKAALKRENKRLKGRILATKEKLTELRVLVSLHGSQISRYRSQLGGSEGSTDWKKVPSRWSEVANKVEKLESEKLIVEARLSESQLLIKSLVEQYRKQLEETTRLGSILKQIYARDPASAPTTTRDP